ncbi:MAG: hypothetical protein MN733_23700 [Nitrososphaera sp.]|nr:hypothetical protein [Nitrososphaera sp.]
MTSTRGVMINEIVPDQDLPMIPKDEITHNTEAIANSGTKNGDSPINDHSPVAKRKPSVILDLESFLAALDPTTFEDGYKGPTEPLFTYVERVAVHEKATPIKNRTWSHIIGGWEILVNGLPDKVTHNGVTLPPYSACLSDHGIPCAILTPFRLEILPPATKELLEEQFCRVIDESLGQPRHTPATSL